MNKLFFVCSFVGLLFQVESYAQWNQLGADIDGEMANDQSGWSVALSADGLTMAVGANENDGNGTSSGHVRVYKHDGTSWVQQGADIDGEASEDRVGSSVSLSADGLTLATGARGNDATGSDAGHVRVFNYNGTNWVQVGLDIDGEASGDQAGYSVSLSDDGLTVAIGAPFNDGNGSLSGHVRVFKYNGTAWVQQGGDMDGEATFDFLGGSVSLSADGLTVAAGAFSNDGNGTSSGHVRVYNYNGTNWIQQGNDIDGEAADDNSGIAVSLSANGSIVAVGATGNDGSGSNAGHVRVYSYNGTDWLQIGSDIDGEESNELSGTAVSLSDDGLTVAIGAPDNDGNGTGSGSVRVYTFDGTNWVQVDNDIDGEAANDESGFSVSLSANGRTVAIGAKSNSETDTIAGHVRVYGPCPSTTAILNITTCVSYTVPSGDETYTTPGTYPVMDTLVKSCGGDSIMTINLTLGAPTSGIDVQSHCNGFVWIDGNTYTSSNTTATHTLVNAAGCDSVVTLNLSINRNTGIDTQSACSEYTWIDGNTYTTSNTTATHTLTNVAGCDSVVTLNLSINGNTGIDTQSACGSFTWIDGNTYTTSNTTAKDTLTNAAGCDSVVTLNLTINNDDASTDVQSACDTFTWIDGNTYTADNTTAMHTLTTAGGCDSVITLNLTVNQSSTSTDTQSACVSYTWLDGITYTSSNNTATYTISNAKGCDSVITLNLTLDTVNISTTTNGFSINAGATGATYQWIDCSNNSVIPQETNQVFTASASGSYAVIVTQNNCSDTSSCQTISNVGMDNLDFNSGVQLYPNPNNGAFTITHVGTDYTEMVITDIAGRIILDQPITSNRTRVELELISGVYLVTLYGEEGQVAGRFMVD